jgi:ferredoxin
MPSVWFQGQRLECKTGDTLRDVLLGAGLSPHNGRASWLNCRGLGTCGTCAVEVTGPVSEKTARETWRLNFPPHRAPSPLRLSCQVKVMGDLTVVKHEGFWGEHFR